LKRRLNARIEYAKFLQDTVKEMANEIQNSQSGEMKKTAEDLDEFMNKVSSAFHDITALCSRICATLISLCLYLLCYYCRLEQVPEFLMMKS